MPPYVNRVQNFTDALAEQADVAFFSVGSDLQYLTGVPREAPNFGAVLHPGGWLEGGWFAAEHPVILTLSRMSAEFNALGTDVGQAHILADHADPAELARSILAPLDLGAAPRIALGNRVHAETIIELQKLYPDARFISATEILSPLRRIKSEEEIDKMRAAGQMTEAAFAGVLETLSHGMTELDVINEVDYQLRLQGSLGSSFAITMYNSGPQHPLIFGKQLETQLRALHPPVALLFDFGAIYDGYCYDFGRTVFFGEPDQSITAIFELVMASQQAGIAALRADQATTTSQVDAIARQVIADGGYGEAFRHRLGHGIGLDVHEPPFLTKGDNTPLEEGMLFTIEPSITQFGGFSARVEDVVVARPDGGEPLTVGFQEMEIVD